MAWSKVFGAWHAKLSVALEVLSFKRSSTNFSLFIQYGLTHKLAVLIYVVDLIISGSNGDSITHFKKSLQQQFRIDLKISILLTH
jgi:hypothetical protein